jgi:glutaminyl-tRNA synthetase
MSERTRRLSNFLTDIIEADLESGRHTTVATRFPPEPNGYLHIGHAKSICLNFGLAAQYGGRCHMRFDDTNPTTEDVEYVESILADIRWLGFDWGEHLYFASDYFETMYQLAELLIEKGLAYVDEQTVDEIRANRGTISEPGTPGPYRDRPVEENLRQFRRMRAGEFPDGGAVLRAKIDLGAANMLMRDPLLYRVRHAHHHRTGDTWCIYPMYDYAHCLEDAIEDITHSICTLEFENNRDLYDWVIEHTEMKSRPKQFEFARLSLSYTMMSKRKLLQLVREKVVDGWDDPRMPTISGLRRRGVTPEAIRAFADLIGVAKANSQVDVGKFEFCVRDDLNTRAPRVLAVLDPLPVTIENWPEGRTEMLDAPYWPEDIGKPGSRPVPMSRTVLIERSDFDENPPKGWYRLRPDGEVRLRYGYLIRCTGVERDASGHITGLRAVYDPESLGGRSSDGRKVKGTVHWVSDAHAPTVEVRLYDRLFSAERPDTDGDADFRKVLNPDSLEVVSGARIEPNWRDGSEERYQFERTGFFYIDPKLSTADAPVFNRIITLKDGWAKRQGTDEPVAAAPAAAPAAAASAPRSDDRPARKTRAQERAIARERDAVLADAYARLQARGLSADDADVLSGDRDTTTLFEATLDAGADLEGATRLFLNDITRVSKDRPVSECAWTGAELARVVALLAAGEIQAAGARTIIDRLAIEGGTADAIVAREGLRVVSDSGAIDGWVTDTIAAHPDEVQRYRDGKTALLGFLVGQAMKRAGGGGDAGRIRERMLAALGT